MLFCLLSPRFAPKPAWKILHWKGPANSYGCNQEVEAMHYGCPNAISGTSRWSAPAQQMFCHGKQWRMQLWKPLHLHAVVRVQPASLADPSTKTTLPLTQKEACPQAKCAEMKCLPGPAMALSPPCLQPPHHYYGTALHQASKTCLQGSIPLQRGSCSVAIPQQEFWDILGPLWAIPQVWTQKQIASWDWLCWQHCSCFTHLCGLVSKFALRVVKGRAPWAHAANWKMKNNTKQWIAPAHTSTNKLTTSHNPQIWDSNYPYWTVMLQCWCTKHIVLQTGREAAILHHGLGAATVGKSPWLQQLFGSWKHFGIICQMPVTRRYCIQLDGLMSAIVSSSIGKNHQLQWVMNQKFTNLGANAWCLLRIRDVQLIVHFWCSDGAKNKCTWGPIFVTKKTWAQQLGTLTWEIVRRSK